MSLSPVSVLKPDYTDCLYFETSSRAARQKDTFSRWKSSFERAHSATLWERYPSRLSTVYLERASWEVTRLSSMLEASFPYGGLSSPPATKLDGKRGIWLTKECVCISEYFTDAAQTPHHSTVDISWFTVADTPANSPDHPASPARINTPSVSN